MATNRTSSYLCQVSTNWWQKIVLLPIFDNRAQTGGNKSCFFPSLTIEHKLMATNRTSSHLSAQTGGNKPYFFQSLSINCCEQIVLLPIFDNRAQTGGNKSYFFPSLTSGHKLWQQIVLLPIFDNRAQTGGNKSYFFTSLTTEHRKLVAKNRSSCHL